MARMYPQEISLHTQSNAERRLYREFQIQLPDDWIVMHGVGWLTRRRRHDAVGEADFVIVHPKRGVLTLEVKGGRIHGEWSSDQWTSVDGNGNSHAIKNPMKQADRSKWELKDKLAEHAVTGAFRYPMYSGVAFPDVLVGTTGFGVDWDRSLVLDSSDLNHLPRALERMFSVEPSKDPLPQPAVDALVHLLQPTIAIERPGLVAEMQTGEARIRTLSQEQVRILDVLRFQRQAVINGCAGSGKTMLAVEKACQLAEQGFDVLLTCYNKNLSAWMQSAIDLQPGTAPRRIRVSHYHDLAVKLCDEAGVPTTVRATDQSYWNSDLPSDLMQAIPLLANRFDAIVVDEGQDFHANWWITLQELLDDGRDGVFYIFQDERQAIYQQSPDLPLDSLPFSLDHNYRSSTTIHERVIDYYEGDPKPDSIGPTGRAVEILEPNGVSLPDLLRKVVSRLLQDERLRLDQLTILTPKSQSRSSLQEGQKLGNVTLTWSPQASPGSLRVSSIHSYKGLESDVVLLTETDALGTSERAHRLCYVGLSRAKHHLVIVGSLPAPVTA